MIQIAPNLQLPLDVVHHRQRHRRNPRHRQNEHRHQFNWSDFPHLKKGVEAHRKRIESALAKAGEK